MLARRLSTRIVKTNYIKNNCRTFFSGSSDSTNDLLKESISKFKENSGSLSDVSSSYFGKLEDLSEDLVRQSVSKSVSMLEELDKEVHKNDYFKDDQITIGINLGPISISRTKIVK